jgi:hypothetical protein
MNKFSIAEIPEYDGSKPVLYKIFLGNKYYLHKGKTLQESAERFLDDVFRGIRNKSCPEAYSKVVDYCIKHPQVYKAMLEVILNSDPDKILRKEVLMYKAMKNDEESLNRTDLEPYKPEWMIKVGLQKRCDNPITEGIVNGKRLKFKFCPNCGRLNK